jgi:HK97 family phage major capsid protein
MKTLEEINARLKEISAEIEKRGDKITADELTAFEKESSELFEMRSKLQSTPDNDDMVERRKFLSRAIANGEIGTVVNTFENADNTVPEARGKTNNAGGSASPEYRTAFLKNLAVRDGVHIFGEQTPEERAAFITTTANTGQVVPDVMMNQIIDLVENMTPMYDDATKTSMTQGFGVPRRKSITQGDANGVAEGTANDDESNDFDILTLSGITISKTATLSLMMTFKSIDAFESWLVTEIADRIATAKNRVIRNRLDGVAPSGGTAVANAGIDSTNILTGQAYTDEAIRAMFGKIKGKGARVIYANSNTIWTKLAGIEDDNADKLFVPNSMGDPIVTGRIYGAAIKVDDEIADDVIYIGTVGQMLANNYLDLKIVSDIENRTMNTIYTAASVFDAGLQNPKSFVKATFATST